MADNTKQKADDTIRTLEDASGVKWPAGVFAHATAVGTPDVLETPIAAALVDGASNPTALILGSAPLVFNGTTWDRLRGDIANGVDVDVTRLPATAANGAAMPGVQLAIGGFDGTAFRQAEFTTNGELLTHVVNAATITEYQEDAPANADPGGGALILVRTDTLAGRTSADGDNVAACGTDKGEQYVKHVDPLTINPIAGQAGVAGGSGGVTANTQRVAIATDAPLPSGSNTIGKITLTAGPGADVGVLQNSLKVAVVDSSGNPITDSNPLAVEPRLSSGATQTSVADSALSVTLLPAFATRKGVSITNDSSADLYLSLNSAAASLTNYSAVLEGKPAGKPAGGYWEAPAGFTGEIRGIWSSDPNDGAARITEFF